jgi:hypothetical protein
VGAAGCDSGVFAARRFFAEITATAKEAEFAQRTRSRKGERELCSINGRHCGHCSSYCITRSRRRILLPKSETCGPHSRVTPHSERRESAYLHCRNLQGWDLKEGFQHTRANG